jgi:hypothetical protein
LRAVGSRGRREAERQEQATVVKENTALLSAVMHFDPAGDDSSAGRASFRSSVRSVRPAGLGQCELTIGEHWRRAGGRVRSARNWTIRSDGPATVVDGQHVSARQARSIQQCSCSIPAMKSVRSATDLARRDAPQGLTATIADRGSPRALTSDQKDCVLPAVGNTGPGGAKATRHPYSWRPQRESAQTDI